MTQENTEEARNKALVQAAFDSWRDGTGSAFDLLDPDAEWTIVGSSPLSRTYKKAEFMKDVVAPFNARLASHAVPHIHGIYADGDTVVILYDATAIAIDGVPYSNRYAWFLQMKDGKVIKGTAFFDTRFYDALWDRVKI
jgi:ketosteroid isomerase-like protein